MNLKLNIPITFLFIALFLFTGSQCANSEKTSDKTQLENSTSTKVSTKAKASSKSVAINTTSKTQQKEEPQQATIANANSGDGFKDIEFGFNIGFLSFMQTSPDLVKKAIANAKRDGFTHFRVYEPFTKGLWPFESQPINYVKQLTDQGLNVLFCISNYPYQADNSRQPKHQKGSKEQFTNRYKPDDMADYKSRLDRVIKIFSDKGMLSNIEFEIGNEPESRKFHWGTAEEFEDIAVATEEVLRKYNRPIVCCGFTGNFVRKELPAYPDYKNFVEKNQIFKTTTKLSFHLYHEGAVKKTPLMKDIYDPRFKDGYITEFNLSGSMPPNATLKYQLVNSPLFVTKFADILEFSYRNDIKRIYLFKLVDVPNKGRLGFFDEQGNPKESYKQFLEIYEVVKDGYKVERTADFIKIIGKKSTIKVAINETTENISNSKIQRSSNTKSYNGKLSKEDWIKYDNQ